jgi:hypothetical protein
MLKIPYEINNLLVPDFEYCSNSTWVFKKNNSTKTISK